MRQKVDGRKKLTDDQVRAIRTLYGKRCPKCGQRMTMRYLAQEFGVSQGYVSQLLNGKRR